MQLNAQLSANLSDFFQGAISEWELRRERGGGDQQQGARAAQALDHLALVHPKLEPGTENGTWPHQADRTPASLARLIRAGALVTELGYLGDAFAWLARNEESRSLCQVGPRIPSRDVAIARSPAA